MLKNTLEKILGAERLERWKSKAWNFSVESFTMNSFSYVFAAPIELCIAGMDLSEHLYTRLAGVVSNTLFGRPYGKIRDWFFSKVGINEKSNRLKKYLADTLVFGAVQIPLYCVNMVIAGAEPDEIFASAAPALVFSGALGGPYGWYLDKVRRKCGIPIDYETGDKE